MGGTGDLEVCCLVAHVGEANLVCSVLEGVIKPLPGLIWEIPGPCFWLTSVEPRPLELWVMHV